MQRNENLKYIYVFCNDNADGKNFRVPMGNQTALPLGKIQIVTLHSLKKILWLANISLWNMIRSYDLSNSRKQYFKKKGKK